jgi:hypothetical protein
LPKSGILCRGIHEAGEGTLSFRKQLTDKIHSDLHNMNHRIIASSIENGNYYGAASMASIVTRKAPTPRVIFH